MYILTHTHIHTHTHTCIILVQEIILALALVRSIKNYFNFDLILVP